MKTEVHVSTPAAGFATQDEVRLPYGLAVLSLLFVRGPAWLARGAKKIAGHWWTEDVNYFPVQIVSAVMAVCSCPLALMLHFSPKPDHSGCAIMMPIGAICLSAFLISVLPLALKFVGARAVDTLAFITRQIRQEAERLARKEP